ncbi:hypothetical protein IFR05_012067 [Cadophora sp. M221]|nr:hypothetical protein IFR05_012067 [Cadophora sp. M221]
MMFADTLLVILSKWIRDLCNMFQAALGYLNILQPPSEPEPKVSKSSTSFVPDRREFYPAGSIEPLITKESIIKELELTVEEQRRKSNLLLVDFILTRAKRVFAILVSLGFPNKAALLKATKQFQKYSFGDAKLPITRENVDGLPFFGEPDVRPWDSRLRKDFRFKQFEFLAPVFCSNELHMEVDTLCIFPFTALNGDRKAGGFGEVFQVVVHPDHYENPILTFDKQRSSIAVKQIRGIHTADEVKLRTLEAEWRREISAHIDMNKCDDGLPHPNIIEFVAAVTKGDDRYLLFRWADGGNLHEFWQDNKKPQLSAALVRDVVKQFCGLTDALEKLHGYGGGDGSYRHGDMKPENILRVRTRPVTEGLGFDIDVGILKIADMGLPPTSMKYSTIRYEPPEVVLDKVSGRSRRQDIWSVGCVVLELIIWLLYGTASLNEFNDRYVVDNMDQLCPYFEIEGTGAAKRAKLHPAVLETMNLLANDPECKSGVHSAIKDLLSLVRTKLLVVNLKQGSPSRATAQELHQALDDIVQRGEKDENYWYTGSSRSHMQRLPTLQSMRPSLLSPASALGPRGPLANRLETTPSEGITITVPSVTQAIRSEYRNAENIDITNYPVDNKFADALVRTVRTEELFPPNIESTQLCDDCLKMNFFEPRFTIRDSLVNLERQQEFCDFCKLRWEVCAHLRAEQPEITTITFTRDQSMIRLNEGRVPVMSLCRSAGNQSKNDHIIQAGFPKLSEATSETHFNIIQHFINDCTLNHPKCLPSLSSPLPTRLLDLGTPNNPNIRVYKTTGTDKFLNYVALSHPWGPGPDFFCTNRDNLKDHEQHIPFDKLPRTFQNAVTTTRRLGLQYLWIDSLCIIQGEGGDWTQEALRMEDVYSSAYCVLAASSAKAPTDGFLVPRKNNKFLKFDMGGQNVSVCRFVDDFESHVLRGPLSKRGWVMQERALAHRTLFFTDSQTYFECGAGVRCETLTTIENQLVSFLGDPNFPSKIVSEKSDRGERIRLYEDFYRQYSRLEFTRWSDRPIAIAGLQKRVLRDLDVRGGFGVFDDNRSFLQRSLLWKKDKDDSVLERIKLESGAPIAVPSWSWMGYKNPIEYLDLPLGGVDWTPDEIVSPWATMRVTSKPVEENTVAPLKATARTFTFGKSTDVGFDISYDAAKPTAVEEKSLRCVVLGRDRTRFPRDDTTHYVLVLKPVTSATGDKESIYERAGAGSMSGRFIDWRVDEQSAKVVVR